MEIVSDYIMRVCPVVLTSSRYTHAHRGDRPSTCFYTVPRLSCYGRDRNGRRCLSSSDKNMSTLAPDTTTLIILIGRRPRLFIHGQLRIRRFFRRKRKKNAVLIRGDVLVLRRTIIRACFNVKTMSGRRHGSPRLIPPHTHFPRDEFLVPNVLYVRTRITSARYSCSATPIPSGLARIMSPRYRRVRLEIKTIDGTRARGTKITKRSSAPRSVYLTPTFISRRVCRKFDRSKVAARIPTAVTPSSSCARAFTATQCREHVRVVVVERSTGWGVQHVA